jgi:hypothetical protein
MELSLPTRKFGLAAVHSAALAALHQHGAEVRSQFFHLWHLVLCLQVPSFAGTTDDLDLETPLSVQ